jgi:hypothetical protein
VANRFNIVVAKNEKKKKKKTVYMYNERYMSGMRPREGNRRCRQVVRGYIEAPQKDSAKFQGIGSGKMVSAVQISFWGPLQWPLRLEMG